MDESQFTWVDRKVTRRYRFRKRSRAISEQASESYLRVDVACGSEGCPCCPATLPSLEGVGGDARKHLIIPDAHLLENFLEVFESSHLGNIVYLTSVIRPLLEVGNMRKSAKLRALYSDRRRRAYLFDNLHHLETAGACEEGGTRSGADLLCAADWYYQHLGCQIPVVVVSDSLADKLGCTATKDPPSQPPQGLPPSSSTVGSTCSTTTAVGAACALDSTAGTAGAQLHTTAGGLGVGEEVCDEREDAELEALLRQMDIGPASSAGSAPRPAGDDAWLDTLLGSAGEGAGGEASEAQRAQQGGVPCSLSWQPAWAQSPGSPSAWHPDRGSIPSKAQQEHQGSTAHTAATPAPAAGSPHSLPPLPPGVHVLSAAQYFWQYHCGTPAVWDIFESRQQALQEAVRGKGGEWGAEGGGFKPHLTSAAIEKGLAQGTLLQGLLNVSRRNTREGLVVVGGGGAGGCARQVLVCGRAALNRAIHGDTVAVRLLPRERWRHAQSLGAADMEEDVIEDEQQDEELVLGGAVADDELNNSVGAEAQPTGVVVGVVQRGVAEVVCTVGEEDERALRGKAGGQGGRQEAVLCVPLDRRLPKIRLRSRHLLRLLGCRLVVRVDGWERASNYPRGHLLRVLGPVNDLTAETDAVLVSSGVRWEPFSEGALRELPQVASAADWTVPAAELAGRRDLRGAEHFVCSIDPPGCTDVDDALSVRWLGSGRVEVGVHIADVSHFVRQGSLLDAEASSRCTTVYLVDRRLDMLPALLSEELCSLRGGQERLAVSVLWTLREDDLAVEGTWFGRTVIRSRYQLEYQQAQDILDGSPPSKAHAPVHPADRPTLARALAFLARLAAARREGRLQQGAVELESAEVRFQTDGEGKPTEVDVKKDIPMMRVVAEMMIAANAAVAERVYRAFPRAALLRRHPPPRQEAFVEVAPLCASLGAELDFSSPATLAASLEEACARAPAPLATLIKSLTTRAMSEAEYFCTGDVMGRGAGMSHFGLALPFYTHFTSPIRRYADVVVHRQLLAAVAAEQAAAEGSPCRDEQPGVHTAAQGVMAPLTPPLQQAPPLPPSQVSAKAAVMNDRHRTAKRAQKDCTDLYLLLLLHSRPHVEAATVYGVRGEALQLFVPKYHLKAAVHLKDIAGVAKPPLRHPGDENMQDPFVLSYRRGIAVHTGPQEAKLVDAATGAVVAEYHPMQRVWVELGADGSRAHGPTLRLRLLAESNPAVQRGVGAEECGGGVSKGGGQLPSQGGCGGLPRGGSKREYHPPGLCFGGRGGGDAGAGGKEGSRRVDAGGGRAIEPPTGFGAQAGTRVSEARRLEVTGCTGGGLGGLSGRPWKADETTAAQHLSARGPGDIAGPKGVAGQAGNSCAGSSILNTRSSGEVGSAAVHTGLRRLELDLHRAEVGLGDGERAAAARAPECAVLQAAVKHVQRLLRRCKLRAGAEDPVGSRAARLLTKAGVYASLLEELEQQIGGAQLR